MRMLAVLLLCTQAWAQDPIEFAIKRLNPSLDHNLASTYAESIRRYSVEYGVEWQVAVVIFKQESNFDYKAVNWKTRDFGLGQLHYKTIEANQVDLGQLLSDPDYAVGQTFKILGELKRKYGKIDHRNGRRWYTRYHSFTPSHRTKYRELLAKHMQTVEDLSYARRRPTTRTTADDTSRFTIEGR